MATVLVTGGTGMLGHRLVPELVERGHQVRVLTRKATTEGAAAQLMHGDVLTGLGIDQAIAGLSYPIFFKAPALAFQLVDAGEVSVRLAEVIEAGPSGRTPDFGGPEVLGIEEIAKTRHEITGRRARLLLRVPTVGPVRDFAGGANLCAEHNDGHVTWSQWLRDSNNNSV